MHADLKICMHSISSVWSHHRNFLVPECCVIKLACTMHKYRLPLMRHAWVDCILGLRGPGRDPISIM